MWTLLGGTVGRLLFRGDSNVEDLKQVVSFGKCCLFISQLKLLLLLFRKLLPLLLSSSCSYITPMQLLDVSTSIYFIIALVLIVSILITITMSEI